MATQYVLTLARLILSNTDINLQNSVRGILFYFDRSYLLQTGSPSIHETSVSLFRSRIFEDPALKGKIVQGACDLVLADRHGDSSDMPLFAASIKMFNEMGVYSLDFRPKMMALSQTFVAAWSDKTCSEKELPEYVSESVKLMENEMKRCAEFELDQTTRNELVTLLEEHLITRKQEELSEYCPDSREYGSSQTNNV